MIQAIEVGDGAEEGFAAGDDFKIGIFYFQTHRSPPEIFARDVFDHFPGQCFQLGCQFFQRVHVCAESSFGTYRFANALRLHGAFVYRSCILVIHMPRFTKLPYQIVLGPLFEIGAGAYAHLVHALSRHFSHAVKLLYHQSLYKLLGHRRMHHKQSVGFAVVRSNFGQKLIVRYARRSSQSGGCINLLLDFFRYLGGQNNLFVILCYIQKSLIQR